MSFAEKLTGLVIRPNEQNPVGGPEIPWYTKYAGRTLGIVGAFFAILFGLWNCLGIILLQITCFISGVLQMLVGFVVMAIEAPACFFCIEYVQSLGGIVDARPLYHKAALYCAIALPPIILCPSLASVFGCGLIFATGVVYGMMGLGKKASAEEMRQAAAAQAGMAGSTATTPTTSDRAGIIKNAQPFSFTGAVGTDSNV